MLLKDFAEMVDVLARLKGRFIPSLNAVPGVLETFARFDIQLVDCSYQLAGNGSQKAAKEVIITGP